jgi:hypothetical protein
MVKKDLYWRRRGDRRIESRSRNRVARGIEGCSGIVRVT